MKFSLNTKNNIWLIFLNHFLADDFLADFLSDFLADDFLTDDFLPDDLLSDFLPDGVTGAYFLLEIGVLGTSGIINFLGVGGFYFDALDFLAEDFLIDFLTELFTVDALFLFDLTIFQ